MKKLLLVALALTTSISLVACGNEDNSTKKPKQTVKTEQHKTKASKADSEKSEKTTSKKDNEKNSDSNNAAVASNEDNSNKSTSSTQNSGSNENNSTQSTDSTTTQPTRSQKDETNGMGDVVTSPNQAITTLSNGLGNNSDFAYTLLSTANHMYEIQVTSKSIRAQGGSGTIGIYDVMEDGTYFLRS